MSDHDPDATGFTVQAVLDVTEPLIGPVRPGKQRVAWSALCQTCADDPTTPTVVETRLLGEAGSLSHTSLPEAAHTLLAALFPDAWRHWLLRRRLAQAEQAIDRPFSCPESLRIDGAVLALEQLDGPRPAARERRHPVAA